MLFKLSNNAKIFLDCIIALPINKDYTSVLNDTHLKKWAISLEKGVVNYTEPLPLWGHQKEALSALTLGAKKSNRQTLVMACGSGKTLVSIRYAEALKAQSIMEASRLLRQILRFYAELQ